MDNVYFIPNGEKYLYVPTQSSVIVDLINDSQISTDALTTLDLKIAQENIKKVKGNSNMEPYSPIIAVFQGQFNNVPEKIGSDNYVSMLIDDNVTPDPHQVMFEIEMGLNPEEASIYMTGKAQKEPDLAMLERGSVKLARIWSDDINQKQRGYNGIASMVKDDFRDPKMVEGSVIPPMLEAHVEYWVGKETKGQDFQKKWEHYSNKYPEKIPSDDMIEEMLFEYAGMMKKPVSWCVETIDQIKGHLGLTEREYPLYEEVHEFQRVIDGSVGMSKMFGIMSGRQEFNEDDALMIMHSILGQDGMDDLVENLTRAKYSTHPGEMEDMEQMAKLADKMKGANPEQVQQMLRKIFF